MKTVMLTIGGRRISQAIIICLALHLLLSANVFAQAWVPPAGEGSLSVTHQKVEVHNHYTADGQKQDRGRIHTHNTVVALEYGMTDRLALDFDLAFIASRYEGDRPHGPSDTGFYDPRFQDVHLGLRYNVSRRPLVVTPFIGVTLPTHDYEVRGHAAVGRGFRELQIGANVGRQLDTILPNGYVNVRYSYSILKRFAGLNLNRSNADLEAGWAAHKSISLRFLASLQKTHGGFDFPVDIHGPDEFDIHDRVAKAGFIQLGVGATYAVNRSVAVHAAYAPAPIYARNTHGDVGFVIGFSWRFKRASSDRIAGNSSLTKPQTFGSGR